MAPFTDSGKSRSENVVASVLQVFAYTLPTPASMPSAMHQHERCHKANGCSTLAVGVQQSGGINVKPEEFADTRRLISFNPLASCAFRCIQADPERCRIF
jgi:hypothetical protein